MDCAEEIAALRRVVGPLVGGEERLSFDLLNAKMSIAMPDGLDHAGVVRAVASTGMRAVPWEEAVAAQRRGDAESWWNRRGKLALCATSGLALIAGFIAHLASHGAVTALNTHDGAPLPLLTTVFYASATVFGGWFVFPKALGAVRRLRADMNLLMTIAVVGAIALGEWFEAASVSFLFSVALLLESWSVGRARNAIRALVNLAPQTARYRCPHDGDIEETLIDRVPLGAEVLVRPGERIPLDGVVSRDRTTVNQAPITGESKPIEKGVGDIVYAGTINNEGAFEFRVSRLASDTTLARIIHMVEEAQSRRAPSEQWVERFARVYTPSMILVAIAIAVFPPVFDGEWQRWFYEALVVLVIACPCALVISTPVSIVAGLATAARAGVLVKGGAFLELAGTVRAIAMDKTGTLTRGQLEVQRIVPVNGYSENELLSLAAAVEMNSEHPIARAIVARATNAQIEIPDTSSFEALPGRGARALIGKQSVWVGSHRMLHDDLEDECTFHETASAMEDSGHSVVAIGLGSHIVGFIGLGDTVRDNAAASVRAIRESGVRHLTMLTGDNEGTAKAIALATGIEEFKSELLPQDKVTAIEDLKRAYGTVAMIGDGVNDAPAMAAADLGIAMAAVGSDAAIETADIALMSDDLGRVPWLMNHARETRNVIKQNIVFALGVKAVFMALALAGVATLWMAIAADMGASLLVIFNALRLLRTTSESA